MLKKTRMPVLSRLHKPVYYAKAGPENFFPARGHGPRASRLWSATAYVEMA